MTKSRLISMLVLALSVALATSGVQAQDSNQGAGAAIGNLLGTLIQAGARADAEKKWRMVDGTTQQCINTVLSSKSVTVSNLVAAGVGPQDQRVAPLISMCKTFMATGPRTDFQCTVTNAKGEQVSSVCNESYAIEEDGELKPVSRDEALAAAGAGKTIKAANFETTQANATRLAAEQRQAEVERQRFLASPEGKRQIALEAAQARQAEAARKRQAAADAVRARQATMMRRAARSQPVAVTPRPYSPSRSKTYAVKGRCPDSSHNEVFYITADSEFAAMQEGSRRMREQTSYRDRGCEVIGVE